MFFFVKRKKIIVDAFTSNINYYNYAKPEKTIKFLPQWWKSMSGVYTEANEYGMLTDRDTMKVCPGINDLYKKGFIVPLWTELAIETKEDGSYLYNFADSQSEYASIVSHPASQHGYSLENLIHLKINVPWWFGEKTGVYFSCNEPTWNYIDKNIDMTILPGVLQFQVNNSANVNIFLPQKNQKITLAYNTPLYHIVPLSENEMEIRHHLVSEEEFRTMKQWSTYKFNFRKNYSARKRIAKQCPFK